MILNVALAIVSAALLVLIFPNFDWVWLAPVCLTPLLVACARESRWKQRFGLGYLTGVIYWFGLCSWIQWTLEQHAGVSSGVAWLLFVLFCLAKALQMGLFGALAGVLMHSRWALPGTAALWVAIEWTHGVTGFEWLNLGNAGADMSLPLRLAPITGVWGMSFIFALLSAAVAGAILRKPRMQIVWLLVLPAMVFLPDIPDAERGKNYAVLVQPNLNDETEWSPAILARTEQQMTMLSLGPMISRDKPVDFVVWPEVPAPFYAADSRFTGTLASIAKIGKTNVIAGAVGRGADGQPLNSALLVKADGTVSSRYDKVNLVPFGEFVPWPFATLTGKVSKEAGDFESGREAVVSAVAGHRVGTFICYESVFPGYIRNFAANGAEVLFNISNDSWFGKSSARYQHLRIVRMRAAENRRWILRATNNGLTVAIDPAGRLIREAPEYQEIAARMPYSYRSDITLYTRFGDWFVVFCFVTAAAALLVNKRKSSVKQS